ncbi:alpha/beta fold hydrolase [Halobaculum gomorrense]|uniref:homoserine O-acetyltransferase n=1 Tax=Halobaculum gomorrense TaxID=43928 RepID=A0A1M5R541_9EURY|nr:alpha/beta fold hydrolase [Halobaculum gomorrense]SHH21487.1 homoserine O-acetyltransferase [Halobaculum gomorrense]
MTEETHSPADAPSAGASQVQHGIENEYYTQEVHGPYDYFDMDAFELENGRTLRNCRIAYATFGELNDAKDNAVLFPHMYSGTSKDMEMYVGEDSAIDPNEYFVILPNQIGNGLSTSPHNTPAPNGQADFPSVRIADDVRAQHRLLTEEFGIDELQLVLGWSMGAQQTYEWAVRYPEMVKRAAPIGGTATNPVLSGLLVDALMSCIRSDSGWENGYYDDHRAVRDGLKRHARTWLLMGTSSTLFREEAWRKAGFTSLSDFVYGAWEEWFLPMDPNNLLTMAWKWKHADVSRITDGDLEAALDRIEARTYVMPFAEDYVFTLEDCREEEAMIPDSELRPIETPWGHFGMFGFDPADKEFIDETVRELLDEEV